MRPKVHTQHRPPRYTYATCNVRIGTTLRIALLALEPDCNSLRCPAASEMDRTAAHRSKVPNLHSFMHTLLINESQQGHRRTIGCCDGADGRGVQARAR